MAFFLLFIYLKEPKFNEWEVPIKKGFFSQINQIANFHIFTFSIVKLIQKNRY
jgi:hypothetical protein